MPGGKKRSHLLKQTCSLQLLVCLSMWALFVTTRHQRVKIETPAHVCSCEFYEICNKNFFTADLRTAATGSAQKDRHSAPVEKIYITNPCNNYNLS